MSKHTQGKLTVTSDDGETYFVSTDLHEFGDMRCTPEQIDANCALFAAAPEMLEALELALVRMEDLARAVPEYESETDEAAAIIRAAIAKAKG